MGRQKSENRIKAQDIYIKSKKKKKLTAIALELGVSESLVRKWKSIDKWDEIALPKRVGANGKKIGAPKGSNLGNKHAVGSKGGRPAKGNKNAVKTGEYETIMFDTLSDEEVNLIKSIDNDKIKALEQEVALLTVREYRVMKRIQEAKIAKLHIKGVSTHKTKNIDGDIVQENSTTNTISQFDIIESLEDTLTRIQEKKIKAIEAISRIEISVARLKFEMGESDEEQDTITGWLEATEISPESVVEVFAEEVNDLGGEA